MPPNCALKMIKMANFMLYLYHSKKWKQKETTTAVMTNTYLVSHHWGDQTLFTKK